MSRAHEEGLVSFTVQTEAYQRTLLRVSIIDKRDDLENMNTSSVWSCFCKCPWGFIAWVYILFQVFSPEIVKVHFRWHDLSFKSYFKKVRLNSQISDLLLSPTHVKISPISLIGTNEDSKYKNAYFAISFLFFLQVDSCLFLSSQHFLNTYLLQFQLVSSLIEW